MSALKNVSAFVPRGMNLTDASGLVLDTARVLKCAGGEYLLLPAGACPLKGRKAAGCLLEPEENDNVLITRRGADEVFILTVLERGSTPARLVFDGDVSLCAESGEVSISSKKVNIAASEKAALESEELEFKAVNATASFFNFSLISGFVSAKMTKLSSMAETMETCAKRAIKRVVDSFRFVERIDQTRAGQVSIRSKRRFGVRAGDVSMNAEAEFKVDGDKIRLG